MKNFVSAGSAITIPSPGTVASGVGVLAGSLFGVAQGAATVGQDLVLAVVGVFDLPKLAGAVTLGQPIYWTGTACTTAADDGEDPPVPCHRIGVAVAAAGSSAATVRVRLSGA